MIERDGERGKERESTPQRHGDILPKAATSLGSALHALSVGCPSRLHTQLSAPSLPLSFCHSFSLSLSLGAVAGSAHWKYFALSVMSCSKFRHSPKMYATVLCDQRGHAAQLAASCGMWQAGVWWHMAFYMPVHRFSQQSVNGNVRHTNICKSKSDFAHFTLQTKFNKIESD